MPSVAWNLVMTHVHFVKTNAQSDMQHTVNNSEIGIIWIRSSNQLLVDL